MKLRCFLSQVCVSHGDFSVHFRGRHWPGTNYKLKFFLFTQIFSTLVTEANLSTSEVRLSHENHKN